MQTNPSSPTRKKPDASHQAFFNEARLEAHEACCAHEAMLRIMKNEFSPARFASCPKDASYCVSNTSFFISQKTFISPLDKSEIRAIITKSLRHNHISGGVPEWPKGTDCKSAAFRFDGSNPSSPTRKNPLAKQADFSMISVPCGNG